MVTYSFFQAKENLNALLEQAVNDGEVKIDYKEGKTFTVKLDKEVTSPLDIDGVDLGITTQEILEFISLSRQNRA